MPSVDEVIYNPFLNNKEDFKRLIRGIPEKNLQALNAASKRKPKHLLLIELARSGFGKLILTQTLIQIWKSSNITTVDLLEGLVVDGVSAGENEDTRAKKINLTGEEAVVRLFSWIRPDSTEEREKAYCALLLDSRANVRDLVISWGKAILEADPDIVKKAEHDRVFLEVDQLRSEVADNLARIQELQESVELITGSLQKECALRQEIERKSREEEVAISNARIEVSNLKKKLESIQIESTLEIERLKNEIKERSEQLKVEQRFPRIALNPGNIESSWQETIENIDREMQFLLSEENSSTEFDGTTIKEVSIPDRRKADWIRWQSREQELIGGIIWGDSQIKGKELDSIQTAQDLLALRWYLLHGLKIQVLEDLKQTHILTTKKRRK